MVTRNREYFSWDVAFLGVCSDVLPDRMRARFCDLLIGEHCGVQGHHEKNIVSLEHIIPGDHKVSEHDAPFQVCLLMSETIIP